MTQSKSQNLQDRISQQYTLNNQVIIMIQNLF
jgi:hypothetical protein